MERSPETFEPPKRYSVPNLPECVKVKVQVMQRVKGRRVDLVRLEQMPQICPGAGPAGVAGAGRIERAVVLGISGVLDVDPANAGEQLAVARVAGRQHTIEEVDAAADRFDEILGRSRPHQIAR